MLRPSPNHGTQRLPNDDDDDSLDERDSPSKFRVSTKFKCCPNPTRMLIL